MSVSVKRICFSKPDRFVILKPYLPAGTAQSGRRAGVFLDKTLCERRERNYVRNICE